MSKKRHPILRFFIILSFIILAAAAAMVVSSQWWLAPLTVPQPPMIVNLLDPQDGSQVPAGWVVPVTAEVLSSETVETVSLYINGSLFEAKPVLAGEGTYQITWSWQPDEAGVYTLVARAEAGDWQADSNVVTIVSPPSNSDNRQPYIAHEGETLAGIAGGLSLDLGDLQSLNSGVGSDEALEHGQEVMVPYAGSADWNPPPVVVPPQISVPSNSPDPAPAPAHPLWQWLRDKLGDVPIALPTTPTVIADDIGCNVRVYILDHAGNESGFRLYRQLEGQSGFTQIAEFGAHNGANAFTYEDENRYGHITYYATAYNAAGESPSGFATTNITDPSCLTTVSDGQALIPHLRISPQIALDRLYCYYSTDGQSWSRFPSSPNAFVLPEEDVFELQGLQAQMDNQLEMECWGWAGDSLHNLGRTVYNNPAGPEEMVDVGNPSFLLEESGQAIALSDWPPDSDIPVPFNVQVTQDPEVCAEHAGLLAGFMCTQAIKDYYAVLVWDWYPGCWANPECDTNIGGFNIYQANPDGSLTLVKSLPKPDRRVVMFPPPTWPELASTQHCFIIRAYAADDNAESADSNVACYQYGELGLMHSELAPAAVRTSFVRDISFSTAVYCNSLVTSGAAPIQADPGNVIVGYDRDYNNGTEPFNCWEKRAYAYRGAMRFDIDSLDITTLIQAHLEFGIVAREYSTNSMATNEVVSCMAQLRLATSPWDNWPDESLIPGDPYLSLPHGYNVPYTGYPSVAVSSGLAHYTIDVTPVVQSWLDGTLPNLGFVISGPDESLPSNNMNCWNELGNIHLVLDYATD